MAVWTKEAMKRRGWKPEKALIVLKELKGSGNRRFRPLTDSRLLEAPYPKSNCLVPPGGQAMTTPRITIIPQSGTAAGCTVLMA